MHSSGIDDIIDVIITGDDVQKGKPDPESYLLAAQKLDVLPDECLVLEDSVNGVTAALEAGMHVIAIATPFTDAGLHVSEIVDECSIVHDPEKLAETVIRMMAEFNPTSEDYD
jgi:beta-phosphoglucomutase-like phosphatase (HAD superfamily)